MRNQRRLYFMAAAEVLDDDEAAGCAVRRRGPVVAPPQPNVMAGQRKIAGRRERAVSTTEYGDAHESQDS
jgi:hypothetical protein